MGLVTAGALLLSLVAGFGAGASAAPAARPIEVQGHRGARALRPENTLPAFAYAIAAGVDTLELDLQVSKDHQLVISHDPLIPAKLCLAPGGKAIQGALPIHTLTLAQIKTYDCGSLRHERFPGQVTVPGTTMPTLDELFSFVQNSPLPQAATVRFNIETKLVPRYSSDWPPPAEFVRMILATAQAHGMMNRIILQSFDHRTLLAAKQQAPKVPISPLLAEDLPDWAAIITAEKAEIISPDMDWVTPEAVRAAHAVHARVVPWTADSPADWDYLLACDVDGMISDDPAALIAYLKAKGRR